MFRRKSIVMSAPENEDGKKAVLTLEEDEIGVHGTLRLYNFSQEINGIASLGFYVNQNVYKAGLTYKSNMLYDFFLNLKEIPSKFSCAVVNFQNAVASPILYGSSEGSQDDVYGSIISAISKNNSKSSVENVLDNYGVDFDDEEKEIIEKEIDKSLCESGKDCSNCIYKKYFYENQMKDAEISSVAKEKEDEKPEDIQVPKEEEEIVFIDKLKPQIDKLFENNPMENNLQNLIPSSKWVKVEYEDDGDFYVFGLLYDESENIKYVCYGVPAVFEEEPPKELAGFPIWLPLDKNNANGFGYWLTYQDASTGEPIRAIID